MIKYIYNTSPYKVKNNNFDFLRLLLASTVFMVHLYDLTEFPVLSFFNYYLSSNFAIKSFFVISGFLIFMSYEKSSTLNNYLIKRFLRIYPAYFFIIFITTVSFYFISSVDLLSYYSIDLLRYLICNLLFLNFLEPTLPGVFEFNNINAVNGALWTLKIEVMFYLTIPFFVYLFNRYNHLLIIIFTYLASILYTQILLNLFKDTNLDIYLFLARQLPGQLSYFMIGAFLYYFYDYLYPKNTIILLLIASLILLFNNFIILPYLEPLALGILIITISTSFYIGNYSNYGDFSYGIYIVHFPIIQLLYSMGIINRYPFYFVLLSIITVSLISIILWHGIEKKFLKKKSMFN